MDHGVKRGAIQEMNSSHDTHALRIKQLVGVYDADGSLRGELSYWIGARLGRRHCSLCDITHGSVKERPEWQQCRSGLPVTFTTFHRDDQPRNVREASSGALPCVIAETENGLVVLLGPDAVKECEGSAKRLVDSISSAAENQGLLWG
jgi:hypothetical protein